ncbi:MAG: hypothetical protein ACTHJM_12245 [Marmoricola sp.]
MSTHACSGEDTLASSAEDFLDLLCGEEDLLDAEFEAIIAANWPEAPQPPEPGNLGGGDQGRKPSYGSGWRLPEPGEGPRTEDAWSRQRSPPD